MRHRSFDEYLDAWIKHGPARFAEQFHWHVLIGLHIMGELDEDASRGRGMTFGSHVDDDTHRGGWLRRRIWPIRKRQYGPAVPHVRIGRLSDSNDLVVQDYSVSTVHAQIGHTDGQVWIEDLGSHNGTQVATRVLEIDERARVTDETELVIGRVKFEYLTFDTFRHRLRTAARHHSVSSGRA